MDPAADPGAASWSEPLVAYVMAVLDTYGRARRRPARQRARLRGAVRDHPDWSCVILGHRRLVVVDPEAQQRWPTRCKALVPPLADLVDQGGLAGHDQRRRADLVIGFIGVIWTVSQFYVTLDVAFARIFAGTPERDVVRRTARGFLWVADPHLGRRRGRSSLGGRRHGRRGAASRTSPRPSATLRSILVRLAVPARRSAIGLRVVVYRTLPPRAPRSARSGCPRSSSGIAIVALSQLFLFLAPRLVGAPRWPGRWRRRSSRWPGCRSRSRRCCTARPGSGSARRPLPAAPITPRRRAGSGRLSPGGSRSAGRTGRWRRVTARS